MVAPIVSGQAIALDDADSEGVEDVDRDLLHRRRAFMRAKGDRLRDELHDSPDFGEDETRNTIASVGHCLYYLYLRALNTYRAGAYGFRNHSDHLETSSLVLALSIPAMRIIVSSISGGSVFNYPMKFFA
ncbi:unnamed protein product [Toxocara canis]|uniref:Ion_trans_2 domain-containing protein n=1 Tax=Toxocara canis TaxID=6265 RepID=A0A183U7K0_TOXCA|nr:unnamed protein product [Toxocara canis]